MSTKIYYNTGANADGINGTDWSSFSWPTKLGNVQILFNENWLNVPLQDPFHMHRPADNYHQIQPIPYVSISEEMIHDNDGRRRQATSISLDGQLIGPSNAPFEELLFYEEQIMNNFHEQFKPFVIVEDDEVIFASSSTTVNSINFEQSRHVGIVDYSISLSSDNAGDRNRFAVPGTFAVDWGLLETRIADREDSFSFNDNGDGTASMSHSIAARGLRKGGQATIDAKDWVLSKRGWNKQVYPSYVPFESMPLLVGETQSEDPANGTFSLTEDYLYNVYKSKVSYGGGGTWEAIADGVKNGTPVTATYSFAAGGQQVGPNACPNKQDALTSSATLQAGTIAAFNHWSDVFESAFPDAYSRGFRLNFENKGVETLNDFGLQNNRETYSLEVGSAAYDAGIGDFRVAEIGEGTFAGCASFPEDNGGWFGISGGGGGDFVAVNGAFVGTCSVGSSMEMTHLAFHELGHSLGFGHEKDDSDLAIMSYAQLAWQTGPLNHDANKCVSMAYWYPYGVENHVQILNHVRGMYGVGEPAVRPIITINISIDDNYPDEFSSVSATVNLKGGQTWSQDDLREYVKADKFWHPGVKGTTTENASIVGGANAGSAWNVTNGSGPEYKSLFHIVQSATPNWISPFLNNAPTSYSLDEPNTDATATHSSELTINVTYDTNTIFGNSADYIPLENGEHNPDSPDNHAYFDYSVSLSHDSVSKVSDVTIEGTIITRHQAGAMFPTSWDSPDPVFLGSAKGKLYWSEAFLANVTDLASPSTTLDHYLYVKANEIYSAFSDCWSLNPTPMSITIDRDPFAGEIRISANFNDKDWIKSDFLGGGIKNLSWQMSLKPGLPHYEPHSSYNVNGLSLIYDVDIIKREMIDVTLKAEYNKDMGLKAGIDDAVGYLYSNYFLLKYPARPALLASKNPKMTAENISYNENEGSIDLKTSFTQEGLSNNIYYPPNQTIVYSRKGYVG